MADPVSNGNYSGIFVFTAPVAEPTVLSFTVPLNGCTIVATATVVTSCSSSADCPGSAAPMCCGGVCVAMSCGGECFSPDGAYDFAWDSVKPMKGSTPSIPSSTLIDVGCVCMLNVWFAALTIFAPTTTTTSSSVEGQASQCLLRWSMSLLCSSTGAVHGVTV